MSKIENCKYFALLEELETANKLIRLGFGELQNFDSVNHFYFLPFQLLSQGFERFMKTYICLAYYDKCNTFPSYKDIRKFSHSLEKLFTTIIDNYYPIYKSPQYVLDYDFLLQDTDIRELLRILSEFGLGARYYNFDLITDNSNNIRANTKESWEEFENKLLNSEDYLKLMREDTKNEVRQKVFTYIIVVFERYISALSRQFIFKGLGQQASQLSVNNFFNFGKLYEQDFGMTDYRYQTQRYQATPQKAHKRTVSDELQRKLKPNYKFKKILKTEYGDDWPFYADEVVIEIRDKHWCIVTIDGYDYGLNGAAQRKFKLSSPHEAGIAILGKSLSNFIKIAHEM